MVLILNLISKLTEDVKKKQQTGNLSDINLTYMINMEILEGDKFFILPYFLHDQDGTLRLFSLFYI